MTRVFRFLDRYPRAQWFATLLGIGFIVAGAAYVLVYLVTFEGR
jgi:hypothetical protein